MASRDKLEVSINAIDNFSNVFDNLNKRLSQLEKKQGKIEPKTVNSINSDMKKLESQLEKFQSGQIAKMTGDKIKKEIDSSIKQAKDLIEKADKAMSELSKKTVNKEKNFNTAKKDFIEFYSKDAAKELKKNKDIVMKAYASLDKGSVKEAKKEAQKLVDKDTIKQKVEVVEEVKKKKTGARKETKKNKVESDEPKKRSKTAGEIKVSAVVDEKGLKKSLNEAVARLNALDNKKIGIRTEDAELKMMRLASYINELNKKKINIKVDDSILGIVKLSTYMNALNAKKIKPEIDVNTSKAKSNLKVVTDSLQALRKEKYKIDLDSSGVSDKISQLKTAENTLKNMSKSLKNIRSRKINLNFNAKDLGNTVKAIRSLNRELTSVKNNIVINIKVNDGDSVSKLKEISSLVRDINKNRNINIRASAGTRGYYNNRYGQPQIGSFFNGVTQFLGRASKGFGSFLEATARVNNNTIALGGTMGRVGLVMSVFSATVSTAVTAFSLTLSSVQTFGNMLMQIGQTIYSVLEPGLELYKKQQSSLFSFTASLQSNGVVKGKRLQDMGNDGRDIARGLSKDLINRAILDAELSAFSLNDLLTSLQGTLPMLMQKGMSLDQAYEVNKGVAGVAKMIQLAPSQILQETRDLAQGSITARTSQVANALGISNADLSMYKGNADAMFDYLKKKFINYSEMLQEFEDTAVGRYQQLDERWQTVTRNIVDGMAPQFKGLFESLIVMTGQWVDKNNAHLNALTGNWEDAQGNVLDKVDEFGKTIEKYVPKEATFKMSSGFVEVREILTEIVEYIAQTVDGIQKFLREEVGITDPLNEAKKLLETIIDLFSVSLVTLVSMADFLSKNQDVLFEMLKTLVRFSLLLMEIPASVNVIIGAFKYLFKVFVSMVEETGLWAKMLGQIAIGDWGGAKNTFQDINNRNNDYLANATKEFVADMKASAGITSALLGDWNNINNFDDLAKVFGAGKVNGKFTEAIQKYNGKIVDGSDKGDSKGIKGSDIRGTQKEDSKDKKNLIKDSQKALKEHIKGLKETLKDSLDELKNRLKESEIAYKEGFISMKEYYETKASVEKEEASLRLQEAKEELKSITSAKFDNEADRLRQLHEVNREIRQYTREVINATKGMEEVSRNFNEGSANISRVLGRIGAARSSATTIPSGVVGDSNISNVKQSAYESFATANGMSLPVLYAILNETKKYNENTEGNKVRYEDIIALAMQESGGNQGAVSSVGAVGIMQLMPETASGLGVNPWDMSENIMGGIKYLGEQLDTFDGDIQKALAAYNAGPYAVKEYGGIPPYSETQNYVKSIESMSNEISSLVNSAKESIALEGYGQTWTAENERIYGQMENLNDNAKLMWNNMVEWWNAHYDSQLVASSGNRASDPYTDTAVGEHDGRAIDFYDSKGYLEDIDIFNKFKEYVQGVLGAGLADEFRNTTYGGNHAHVNAEGWNWTDGTQQRGVNIDEIIGGAYYRHEIPNTQEIGNKVYEEQKNLHEKIVNLASSNDELVLLPLEDLKAQLDKLDLEHKKEKDDILNKMRGSSSQSEIDAVEGEIDKKFAEKTRELRETVANNWLEYSINAFESWGNLKGFSVFKNGGGESIKNAISKYYEDFYANEDNPIAPAYALKQLRILFEQYQSSGNLLKAESIRKKINDAYDSLNNMINSWVDRYRNYFDNYSEWLSNSDATNLQKEMGEREINARKNEGLSNLYGIQIEENQKRIDMLAAETEEAMESNKALEEKLSIYKGLGEASEEYAKHVEDISKIESDINRNSTIINENSLLKNKLEMQQEELRTQKLLADQLKEQPNLWKDVRKAAVQALEDGIVEFLTDGITKAESLGEALRNLAVGILKEIQQVFAKRIALQISNGINSLFGKDGNDDYARQTGYDSSIYNNAELFSQLMTNNNMNTDRIINAMTNGMNNYGYSFGNSDDYSYGLGSFSNPWYKSDMNKNSNGSYDIGFGLSDNISAAVDGFYSNISDVSVGLGGIVSNMQTANGLLEAENNIMSMSNPIKEINKSLEASEQSEIQQIMPSLSLLKSYIDQVSTALQNLATSAYSSSGSSGFARGGIVFGSGTSTSDSIPAMLSNGEAVLNAKAVRSLGTNFINSVNSGHFTRIRSSIPRFADGGVIGDAQQNTARGMTDFAKNVGTSVTTTNQMNIALVRDDREAMEHFLRSPRGQKILVDFQRGNGRVLSRFN